VLSISIDNENYIDYGSRIVKIYPTDVESYKIYLERNGCEIISELENYDNIIWEMVKRVIVMEIRLLQYL